MMDQLWEEFMSFAPYWAVLFAGVWFTALICWFLEFISGADSSFGNPAKDWVIHR